MKTIMEKKLGEVLHLLTGCDIKVQQKDEQFTTKLYGVCVNSDGTITAWSGDTGYNSKWFSITPLLRRLDSMTEEDANEFDSGRETNKIWPVWHDAALFEKGFHSFTPEQTLFLLKKGFDLFNLIDEKLAIDINQ